MRIAIIGGGISGLYLAHKLSEKNHIDIYEKSDRLGGRIHSIKKNDITLETGAGRINKTHKRVWKLLKELNLEDHVIKMASTDTKYIKDGKLQKQNDYFKNVVTYSDKYSKTYLKDITLDFFFRKYFPDSIVDDIMYSFGYDSEFLNYNAYDAIKSIKNDLLDKNVYYVFKNGLSTIITTLEQKLKAISSVTIYMNHKIENLEKLTHDKVIMCVTNNDLKTFNIHTDAIGNPLARVYAKFPIPVWFDKIGKITTNNQIRQFIPINYETGIVMASYCTDKWAENWKNLDKKLLQECLMYNLRKTFPMIKIPEPEWISLHYWEIGAHAWTTHAKYHKNKASDHVLISGEVVSINHHGWMEGALEAADETLKLF